MEAISFIGLGAVGLVTQICLASKGVKTIGVDVDEQKLKTLNSGSLPFYEPQLKELLSEARTNVVFSGSIEDAVSNSSMTFITVGTPSKPDGSIDLAQITQACKGLGKALGKKPGYHVVVVKSTVVPTTTDNVIKNTLEAESGKIAGKDFGLVVNPEFLREGHGVHDTFHPHLLVIGSAEEHSGGMVERFWLEFYKDGPPEVIRTNWVTAELIKYSNNSFLATKISFINSIANICQKLPGADVEQVARAIGKDPRIGELFLKAGPGFGGSCLPKDLKAFIRTAGSIGYDPLLFASVDRINETQPLQVIALAKSALGELREKAIAVLGVAFKKDTDDIRDAVSLKVIEQLINQGARVRAHDPMALDNLRKYFGGKITYASDRFECIGGADCCIVLTEWDEYGSMKPEDFVRHMKNPCIIDARRVFSSADFVRKTSYLAIGLGSA